MDIYRDIKERTNGDVYLGVVGPVRTGKSTFIKRFMQTLVLPSIQDSVNRNRANDELPQSAAGKMIMTTEPKFVPKDAAVVTLEDGITMRCRLVDSVGYMVEGATGHEEEGNERFVQTPWFDYEIPFTQAAELGTRKVIVDHSTIGIVVTSDGSITDLPREAYIEAERKTVKELSDIGKPFVVILNSRYPKTEQTKNLAKKLELEYGTSVLALDCEQMNKSDIDDLFHALLMGFPVSEYYFYLPNWVEAMEPQHELRQYILEKAKDIFLNASTMKDVKICSYEDDSVLEALDITEQNLANGCVKLSVKPFMRYYYEMFSDILGCKIKSEYELLEEIKALAHTKKNCIAVSDALSSVAVNGYGAIMPKDDEIQIEEPELIHSGNKYGVKIHAKAPSVHLIKANISTEIAPIIGTREQATDLIEYINGDKGSADNVWDVTIFGKTIRQLVEEGLNSKIQKMNEESKQKLQDTMEKIVNDSNGGMVCIII